VGWRCQRWVHDGLIVRREGEIKRKRKWFGSRGLAGRVLDARGGEPFGSDGLYLDRLPIFSE
jgi:hypothetical protein